MLNLDNKIQYLKGIGPGRSQTFAKLGIITVGDMLTFFPVWYQDRKNIVSIRDAYKQPQSCIFGKIGKAYDRQLSRGLCLLYIEIFDGVSTGYARFFRKKNPYSSTDIFASIKKAFEPGTFAYIYGSTKTGNCGRFIDVDDYETVKNEKDKPLLFNRIMPVYPLTEGLNQRFIREAVKSILDSVCGLYPDVLDLIPDFGGIPRLKSSLAIQKIHYPGTLEDVENARRAFALQEFFIFESALSLSHNNIRKKRKEQRYEIQKTLFTAFKRNLKLEFTKDQKKAINDIFSDMQSLYPMNRMLMGDVGCGKTVVALSAVLLAVGSGYQTMIVAPTEILAEQHYLTVSNMLLGLSVKAVLATSLTLKKKSEREKILAGFENGDIKIAIGTHSLIEDKIKFKNLSLIVVDEQQKFGVMQKFAMSDKARSPDILMMTATPIPRSLALTVYGGMDMTAIKQLPPGRTSVKTYFLAEQSAYIKAIEELKNKNQVYIVYPIIDESDKLVLKSAEQESKKLSQTWFRDFKVGLLHGRMKSSKKNKIMLEFKNKEFDVLISTTVIGVGIDVPDVTVMIIQHAERFGLSDLHQLRGRIGRGSKQSYAYLIGDLKNEAARKRLSVMTSTNNGFKIAEEDLKMRGHGELMGTLQHGFPKFKAGDLIKDADIIEFTKNLAAKITEQDPYLSKGENAVLKSLIYKHFSDKIKFINIG
ncbi:ATP-dependent DNA helicase RecG [Candidatus Endomicrobiellum trichonymphae]|uniref:Probable DNA 3'-5' helicase RecG n=1 Tax=Endomicrobium trichonymphae TaxID=1408204 RepID=B1H0Q8_ENDTX|nr:ATP-dependent DNA helicase RecG [Candidatus Endomicrobium trichonymphae]BAG14090.1 ATP-dependent DNA helicase [Candidatus Endomicrobium trichonymphae]